MLTVTAAAMAITPDALTSGVLGTAYSQAVDVTGGVGPFSWAVTSGSLPHNLVLGDSTTSTVIIAGTPDEAASVPFTLAVTDSAQNTASKSYNLAILLQADSLAFSGALDFGSELVGATSSALTETLTNSALSEVTISAISIVTDQSGTTEFKQTATTCGATLAAGASCMIDVTFTPALRGPRTASLSVTDNTANSPQVVPLNGQGVTAGPNATPSVDVLPFGTQLVGTTSPALSITLSNYGTASLNIGSITTTGAFAESDNCVPSVASGASCTISVTFTPPAAGAAGGTLSIADDAAGNPQAVTLTGTGSASTPALTGNCVEACGIKVPTAQCPAGQPAESPGQMPTYPCGPIGSSVPVDRARKCFTGGSTRVGQGYCGTQ
jgi:hypothetical protein